MTDYIIGIVLFLIILLVYLHYRRHIRKVNSHDIIIVDKLSKRQHEETCDMLQPFVMRYGITSGEECFMFEVLMREFANYDINIYTETNTSDSHQAYTPPIKSQVMLKSLHDSSNCETPNPVSQSTAVSKTSLLSDNSRPDSNPVETRYISYNNQSFIYDCDLDDVLYNCSTFLRPLYTKWTNYDIIMGLNSNTPLYSSKYCRNFFHCIEGVVECKLISFKYYHLFNTQNENYMDYADVPIFDTDAVMNNSQWKKIKHIDVALTPGECMYVPPYWFCAFKFDDRATIIHHQYSTFMNNTVFVADYVDQFINNILS